MTVDLRGNVYIAASYDQRVRRVDPNGIIWTAAGSGVRDFTFRPGYSADFVNGGFSGDGGLATQAELNMPTDVALDAQGNLYIVDCGNNRIRMVNREGFIRTFAGNLSGASVSAGDGGPGVNASLVTPVSVAVDMKGNVYVAEFATHKIRRIAPDGQNTITTFAGTGQAGFSGDDGPAAQALLNRPMGVAVDVAGNVYIADYQNHRVRKVDIKGVITTFAGTGSGVGPSGEGGPALQARITYPRDLAVDAKGYVYISTEEQLIKTNDYNLVHRVSPVKEFEIPCIRLSDTSLHFETASINQTAVQSITVSNAGKGTPLLVEVGPDKDVPEFKVISLTNFLVQPGGLEKVAVRYTPSTLRSTSATIQIYHNGTEANPLRVSLSGSGPIRTADFNGDGMVDLDDFFLFAGAFYKDGIGENVRYDLDGSGRIDFEDFFLFAARFGK
jgi:sugar lactone lactonase YvrE